MRRNLINHIKQVLKDFNCISDERFEKEFDIESNQVLMINGHVIPAPPVHIKYICELHGTGHVEDKNRKDEFELIYFERTSSETGRHYLHTNIYYDELDTFTRIAIKLFNIPEPWQLLSH